MTEGGGARQKPRLSIHPPGDGRSTQQASATYRGLVASSVTSGRGQTMLSMPLAYPSTLDHRPLVAHGAVVGVLRGGALEPEPQTLLLENRRLKQTLIASV